MCRKAPGALGLGHRAPSRQTSVFVSVLVAFGFCLVLGSPIRAQAGEPDMDLLNTRAVQTLAASGLSVRQVDFGDWNGIAVTSDGSVWTWGSGRYGQLGLGEGWTDKEAYTPQLVRGLSDVRQVAIGNAHAAAVTSDGKLYTWGYNESGQLGLGDSYYRVDYVYTPQLVGSLSGVKQVALGVADSAAVTSEGKLYTWGIGWKGQLGLGEKVNSSLHGSSFDTPQLVEGLPGVKQVALGYHVSAAVTSDGRLYTWGSDEEEQDGGNGRLGLGEGWVGKVAWSPQLVNTLSGVKQVSLDDSNGAAVTSGGRLYTWGDGSEGRLGLGEGRGGGAAWTPQLVGTLSGVEQVAYNRWGNGAAVTSDGRLWTWGGDWERLGLGERWEDRDAWTPQLVGTLSGVRQVALGVYSGGAVTSGGRLYTWGSNAYGLLGLGEGWDSWYNAYTPQPVPAFSGTSQPSSVTLTPSSLSLEVGAAARSVSVGGTGNGRLGVSVGDEGVARASLTGTTLRVTPVAEGKTTITVTRAETSQYSSSSAILSVSVGKGSNSTSFTYGKDNLPFSNSSGYFFNGARGTYELTDTYFDLLTKGMNSAKANSLKRDRDESWGGSCFGMASTVMLMKGGSLHADYFQSNASATHDLASPKDSSRVKNLVNYYQLLQSVGDVYHELLEYDRNDETPNNENLVRAVQSSDYPVVFCMNILKGRVATGGHALVAYDCTKTASGYEIKVWDPNYAEKTVLLNVSKDFSTSQFESGYSWESGSYHTYITSTHKADGALSSYKNLEQGLKGQYPTIAPLWLSTANTLVSNSLTLRTNYSDFSVTSSNGKSATVENGEKVSGNLDISFGEYLNEPEQELSIQFDLPVLGQGDSYTIAPASSTAQYKTSLLDGDGSGFFSAIEAAADGTFTIYEDGKVSSQLSRAAKQSVSVTSDDAGTQWDTVEAKGTVSRIEMSSMKDREMNVSSDDNALLDITVSTLHDEQGFDAQGSDTLVRVGDNDTITVGDSSSGPNSIDMYRMYNQYTGEHLYTASVTERDQMVSNGWTNEGIMWKAPASSHTPIWRLYNPWSHDHHYARTQQEYESLEAQGWEGEGVKFYSAGSNGVPIYRLFNPYQQGVGAHHYTNKASERDANVAQGWTYEDVGWYGLP